MKTRRSPSGRSKIRARASKASLPPPASSPRVSRANEAARLEIVDAARGMAIAMMIAYHFCFDLTYYGWAQWAMLDDPGWIAWRSIIVASFLVLVGLSLALREARESHGGAMPNRAAANKAFVKRWLQVAGAALVVTAGSVLLFPQTFIYFGVVHFVAVALLICRRAPRLGIWAVALGVAAIALGVSVADPVFDPRIVNWIGFPAHKPITEDYVPLFPWLGVVLGGCGLGALWARRGYRLAAPLSAAWQATPRGLRVFLSWMGRWSLTIYLVHQPLLIGAMGLVKRA